MKNHFLLIAVLTVFTLFGLSVNAQQKYVSNWQGVESSNQEPRAGVSVYKFIIDGDTILNVDKKFKKVLGRFTIGETYVDGDDSWKYDVGVIGKENLIHQGKKTIIFTGKNSFTGKWSRVVFILKTKD
jgi:hypothetical protein